MPRRRAEEREALARAAFDLFAEQGVGAVSVEAICATAGLDEVAFQQHFENKSDLVRSVVEEWSEAHLRRLHELDGEDAPFEEKVWRLVEERRRLREQLGPMTLRGLGSSEPELARFVGERREENRDRFAAFLVAAQERGEVRDDVAPELMVAMLEQIDALQVDRSVIELAGGEQRFLEAALGIFFRGVLK